MSNKIKLSAGLIVIQDNKILLVHPKNASWWGTFSIPKGIVEPGESPWDIAIRETEEETGVKINKKDTFCAGQLWYRDRKKTVLYFLAYPSQKVEVRFTPNNEVDWAGFMSKEEAIPRIFKPFKPLLVYVRPNNKEQPVLRIRTKFPRKVMQRTKQPKPKELFPNMERRGVNLQKDFQYAVSRVRKIMIPLLREQGFKVHWVQEESIDEVLPPTQIEAWANWNMRLSKKGAGMILKVSTNVDNKVWLPIQPTIIGKVKPEYVRNYPIFNMPGAWVNDMMKDHSNYDLLVKYAKHTLVTLGIHFLILTESGNYYWLGSWKDIPEKYLFASYSKTSKKPNKLKTSAKFNLKKFKHVSYLKEDLLNRINEFNKTILTYGEQYRKQRTTKEGT